MRHRGLGFIRNNLVGLFSVACVLLVTFFAAWFSFSPKQTYQANAEVDLLEELNKLENLPLDGRFYLKSDWFSDFEYDENYDVTYLQKSDVKSILFLKGTMSDYFPDYLEDENFLDIWMYEDENDSQGRNSCQATYTLDEDGLATIYVVGSVAITAPENSSRLFAGFENLETLYLEIFVADKTTDMSFMFAENPKLKELYMPLIESCNATNMSGMFYNDISLENLDVSCLDTSNVEDMTGMFCNCQDLKSIDVSTWDTSNVLYMGGMFSGCEQLKEIDLSTFDTSNVTIMKSMFAGCSQATYFNLEGWDTTNVVNFQQMFASCYKLKSLDLSPLNMRSGTNFSDFFNGTVNLERLVAPREVVMGAIEITASTPLYKVMSSGTAKTVVSKIDANNCSTDEEKLFLVSGVAITIVDNLGNGISFQSVVLDNNNFAVGIMLKNAIDLTLPEVVKDGYKFVGWEMDAHYVTSGGFGNAVVTLTETADFKYVLHVEKITCAADIILTANYLKLEGFLPEKLLCAYDNAFISREQCEELEEVYFLYKLPGGSISEDCFKINIEQPNISKDLPGKEVYADVFLYMDEINENTGYYKKMYVVCNYELYAPQNCTEMFYGLTNLKKIIFENFNTSYTEEFVRMFGCCDSIEMMDLSTFDMSSARNLSYMFEDCVSLVYPIFYTWNTESVTDVSGLFRGCKELSVVHMANFDLSNCGSALNMFEYCESLFMLTSPYAIGDFEIDLSFKYFVSENVLKPDVDQQVPDFELLPEHLDVVEYITKDSCGNDKYADHNMMVSILVIKIYLNGKYETATEILPSSKSFLASQGVPVVDGWIEENTQDLFNVGVEILSCDTTLLSTGDFTIDESFVRVKVNSSGFVSIDVDIEYADFLTLSTEWSYRLNVSRSQIREITILNGSPENYGIDSNSCVHISRAGGVDENGEQIIPDSSKALLGRVEYDEDPDGTRFAIVYIYAPGNKIFAPPDSTELFADCENMTTLNLGGLDTSYTYSMNRMFGDAQSLTSIDVSNFNTENVVDMRTMFAGCKSLTELDVSNFNTELVESFYGMFGNCHLVEDLDLGNFVTTIADDMSYMFYGCTNLTNLNILSFDTQNVVGMAHMFFECAGLTELDLSHFDTGNVESMSGMFAGASNLENINFEGFATSNLVNMYGMFEGCSSLKIVDLSPFNLTNVTDMSYMFYGCELLEECLIRSATLSLQQATEMFVGCTNLIYLDLYGLDLSQVSDINDFLADCKNLLEIVVPMDVGDNVIVLDGCFVNGLTDEIVTEITQAVCDVKDEDGNNTFLARALIIEIYVNGEFIGDEWSPVDEVGIEINVCEWIGSYYFAEAEVTIDNSECNKTLTYENPMLIIPAAATGVVGLYFQFQPKDVFLATDWFEVITKSMEGEGKEPISFGQVAEIYIVDELHFSSVRPPVLLWTGSVGVTDADGSDYDTSFTAVTADVIDVGEGMISIYLYSNFGNIICAPKEASKLFFNFYNMTTFQLNNFNTSYAVNMVGMFNNCYSLSELDLSGFDTSNAVDLSCMFANCASLTNLDLGNFDTTNVESMREMFAHCESLGMLYLDSFDTSEVQNFAEMFMGCTNLMWVDMSSFDMSNQLFTMIDKQGFAESFFADCENLRRIDIPYIMGDFEIVLPTGYFALENDYSYSRQLTLQQSMCSGSKETLKTLFSILLVEWTINGELMPIEGCEVRLIEEVSFDLVQLFGDRYKVDVIEIKSELICGDVTVDGQYLTIANGSCGLFRIEVLLVDGEAWLRQDWFEFTTISKDQVESIKVVRDLPEEVTSMSVDVGCADIKGDISKDFDPVYVYCQQKQNELYDVYIYTPYILYAPENSSSLFANFANATVIDVGHLNTSFVTDMSLMFRGCSVVGTLELGGFDTTNVTTMNNMFESCDRAVIIDVSGFVTKNVTDFSYMFFNCRLLRELDVSGFETPIATNMSHMFDLADDNSYKRVFVDVSNFDTANVTNMSYMFNNAEVRANDLATFDTSKVEDMAGMFYRCYISGDTDVLMLDNFDTINVTNMASMFNQTRSSAKKLDLRNFDTSKTVYMNDMFKQSSFTEIDISNFDTSSLVSASGMFERGLLTSIDISHFDMSKIKNISHMFLSCDNLEEIKFNPLMDGIKIEYASQAFSYCQKLTVLDLSWIDLGDYKDGRDINLTSGSANLKKLLLPQNLQENSSIFLSNKHNLYFETTKEYAGLSVFAGQESVSKANPTVLVYRSNLIVDYGYDQAVENRYYFYSQESQTVDLGTLERDGFAFAGWEFVSGDASVEANQMTIEGDAFEDITVKALWTEVFKIDLSVSNLDSKGKPIKGVPTINISSFNKLDGDTLGELPEPTLKGYIFEGWYLDENFTEKVYEGMTVSADMVLYAKWTKKSIGWILYLGLALLAVIVGLVAALVIFDSKKSKYKKLLDHEKSLFVRIMEILTGRKWKKR